MQIMVSVMLMTDDELNMTPDEIAVAVLEGLNGDPEKDTVQASVQQAPETGSAGGNVPPPPPPSESVE